MQVKKAFQWSLSGLVLVLLLFLLARNSLLHFAVKSLAHRLEERFQLQLIVGDSRFNGLLSVQMTGLSLLPEKGDTLFHADSLKASVSLRSLLLFNFRIKSLQLQNGFLRLSCRGEECNYANLISETSPTNTGATKQSDYAKIIRRLFYKAFDFAPQDAELKNLDVGFRTDSFESKIRVPLFTSSEKNLSGEILDMNTAHRWQIEGSFDQDHRRLSVNLIARQQNSLLPLIKELLHVASGFDTLHFAVNENRSTAEHFIIDGELSAAGFSLFHPKISEDTVRLQNCFFRYCIDAGRNSIAIDSTSYLLLNKIPVHPYVKVTMGPDKVYVADLSTDAIPANDFFYSLPAGVFDETREIKAAGRLKFSLRFRLDSSMPDSVEFDSKLEKEKFRLLQSGKEDLFKMNSEFEHTVYEYGRPFRSFMVGPSNPDFTPLDQVGTYLKNAVLTSEDGSFFFHNGFNEEAFRQSIAENFRKGKFVRGGSTISMQLVKNVYLSRKKTIARKAEEALLVWLIESNRLCSKERMFEVYLNIIELGPGVYGVGEASRFYFNKKPADLTLSESIFLASLLPHPKWFKYSFDEQGNLKSYLADYYRVVSNFMLRKNLISQEEYDGIVPNVALKGMAREMILPSDSIPEEEE